MAQNQFDLHDVIAEISALIEDSNRPMTKPELSDFLIRIYSAAEKLAMVQKAYTENFLDCEERPEIDQHLREFPASFKALHQMAESVLVMMDNQINNIENGGKNHVQRKNGRGRKKSGRCFKFGR